jgi:hypothetical protein
LDQIESVTIASLKYFKENPDKFLEFKTSAVVNAYRKLFLPGTFHNGVFSLSASMGWATSLVPLVFIASKDKTKEGKFIITKPFSRKGFEQLIEEFKERNILIDVEPGVGLTPEQMNPNIS